MPTRLQEHYTAVVKGQLQERFGYQNPFEVPRLEKIVINMGVGEAVADSKKVQGAVSDLTRISGQKPVVTRAKKSIATFKLREGMPIGCKVTLRRDRMYEFLDRLVNIALPRVRDFRGLSGKSFDGRGNYALGLREQIIFPEIDYDAIDQVRGLDVAITTTARTDEEGFALLLELGMPFQEAGRPGGPQAEEDDAEEERRHEEARLKAEAEQAALEQLKAENPEAYEKPEEPEEGEGEENESEESE